MNKPYGKGTALRHVKGNSYDEIIVQGVQPKDKTYQMKCIYDGLNGGEDFYFFDLPFDQIYHFCPVDDILAPMEKHLVLYTKGLYVTSSRMQDLMAIASKLYTIPLEYTYTQNVYHMVVDVYLKLAQYGYIQETMREFLFDLVAGVKESEEATINRVTTKLLSEIQLVTVTGLQLGEPDPSVLPVR